MSKKTIVLVLWFQLIVAGSYLEAGQTQSRYAVTANRNDDTASLIDLDQAFSVVSNIDTKGDTPKYLTLDSLGHYAYVLHDEFGSKDLRMIDLRLRRAVALLRGEYTGASKIDITSDGKYLLLFSSNKAVPDKWTLYRFSLDPSEIGLDPVKLDFDVAVVGFSISAVDLALSPDGVFAFISHLPLVSGNQNKLVQVDVETMTSVRSIDVSTPNHSGGTLDIKVYQDDSDLLRPYKVLATLVNEGATWWAVPAGAGQDLVNYNVFGSDGFSIDINQTTGQAAVAYADAIGFPGCAFVDMKTGTLQGQNLVPFALSLAGPVFSNNNAYLVQGGDGLAVFNPLNFLYQQTIAGPSASLGSGLTEIAKTTDNLVLYNGNVADAVDVFDSTTNTLVTTIPVGDRPVQLKVVEAFLDNNPPEVTFLENSTTQTIIYIKDCDDLTDLNAASLSIKVNGVESAPLLLSLLGQIVTIGALSPEDVVITIQADLSSSEVEVSILDTPGDFGYTNNF